MATHARQQYFADESSLSKERREFSIADEIQEKIDSVEEGAQVNKIETVKVNGTALVPDMAKAVNVEVPDVIDNLYTITADDALSAKQGKVLYDYIQNIASRGRFLSNWNCATGLPVTNPTENPYPYKAGDYYSVSNVASGGGTNYRPNGSSYIIGQASTTVETDTVAVSDFYLYDGTNWLLLTNSARQIAIDSSLSTTSTNPVENRVITNALNLKHPGEISNVAPSNPVEGMLWYDTTNDQLKVYDGTNWNVTGKEYHAGEGISIGTVQDYSAMQGPAPDGFHVPLSTERQGLKTIMDGLSLTTGNGWKINLHMPFAGRRRRSDASISYQDSNGCYWSSSSSSNYAYYLDLTSSGVGTNYNDNRAGGFSVRCFKDSYVTPNSSWTVVQGALGSAGIFWNQSEGLISITDGSTGYTMMDKNLGATTVYNDGDTLAQANMGNMYQWGNNHGFPSTGTISSTSSTQVDASTYGPGNYYESDTFITGSGDWSSVQNDNLWGATTGVITIDNVITNTGVTSVNGNTGAVTVEEVPSGGTEGQVLTQTNNGPAWQNPTGGADIEYVTQVEYNALPSSKLTDGKHYFIFRGTPVTGVTLNESQISLTDVGDTYQLTATVIPSDAYDTSVTWSSDNTSIATVSQSGLVTCVTPGICTITVTTTDGGFTATCGVDAGGWTPGANTVAYYPLDSVNTVNDLSGNGYTLTNPDDEIAFNTYQGVDCAYFYKTNFYNVLGRTEAEQIIPTGDFTWNAFLYVLNEYQASPRIFRDYSGSQSQGFVIYNGKLVYQDVSSSVGIPISYDSWHLYTITGNFTDGTFSFYLDGVLQGTATGNRLPGTGIFWGSGVMSGYSQQVDKYCGGMSKVVLEDRIRTGQEILDYLEQNKANYGL